MENKESKYKDILFGYQTCPSYGHPGGYGGFSIDVYPDGRLVHKTYIFSSIAKEKEKAEYKISEESVEAIKKILEEHKSDISSLDKDLNNNSCYDGASEKFIFSGKQITTWEIEYHDEEEIMQRNPKYYNEYLPVLRQENLILLIFEMVTEILKTQGVTLKLYEVSFRKIKKYID